MKFSIASRHKVPRHFSLLNFVLLIVTFIVTWFDTVKAIYAFNEAMTLGHILSAVFALLPGLNLVFFVMTTAVYIESNAKKTISAKTISALYTMLIVFGLLQAG